MSTRQGVTLSYVMSLVGGLIVLIISLVNLVWFGSGASNTGALAVTCVGQWMATTTLWEATPAPQVSSPQSP